MYTKKEQKHEKYPLAKKQYFFSSSFFLSIYNITCTLPHLIYINKELLQIHKIHYVMANTKNV